MNDEDIPVNFIIPWKEASNWQCPKCGGWCCMMFKDWRRDSNGTWEHDHGDIGYVKAVKNTTK
jgi:hypothetical protein